MLVVTQQVLDMREVMVPVTEVPVMDQHIPAQQVPDMVALVLIPDLVPDKAIFLIQHFSQLK
jgi:hypothetical protein